MEDYKNLKRYNKIYKEMDFVYHEYAKKCGISDMAYWILYSLAIDDGFYTQKDLCNGWCFTPQTLNSALKDLEKKDLIYFEYLKDNKKSKLIMLNENGKKFVDKYIFPIINAESNSFLELEKNECEIMLDITKKYMEILKEKVNNINF